jgi:uncharacterized protein involved in exopolysaccharide biosynthesis
MLFIPKADEARVDSDDYQKTQMALLRSRLVLNAALREPSVANLPTDPVAWLEREIRIESPDRSEIVRVSLTGDDATLCEVIVNAVVKAYLAEVVDKEKKRRKEHVDELQKQCNLLEESVKRAQDRRRAIMGPGGPVTMKLLEQQQAATWKALGEIRATLRELLWEEKTLDAVIPMTRVDQSAEPTIKDEDRKRIAPQALKKRIEEFKAQENKLIADLDKLDKQVKGQMEQVVLAEVETLFIDRELKKLDLFATERDKLVVEYDDPPRVRLLEEAAGQEKGYTIRSRWMYSICAGLIGFVVVVLNAVWVASAFRNTSTQRAAEPERSPEVRG